MKMGPSPSKGAEHVCVSQVFQVGKTTYQRLYSPLPCCWVCDGAQICRKQITGWQLYPMGWVGGFKLQDGCSRWNDLDA